MLSQSLVEVANELVHLIHRKARKTQEDLLVEASLGLDREVSKRLKANALLSQLGLKRLAMESKTRLN